MKSSICIVGLLATIIIPPIISTLEHGYGYGHGDIQPRWFGNAGETTRETLSYKERKEQVMATKRARPLGVGAGSRLPDCSHACGSCSPCKLVIVSSVCFSLAQAETCPVSYRCMCNNKSYPVP